MRRYWLAAAAILAFLLMTFVFAQALAVAFLDDPRPALEGGGLTGALVGVGLLVADALLPIPASLVMVSLGALYGALAGILLAFAGRFGMAVAGFAIGRAGGPLLDRAVPGWERGYAERLVDRWGAFAIVVSRPVPLLAETVTILAGASRISWRAALAAAFVGSIPEAVAYGLTGALAASFDNAALIFLAFLVVATLFRLIERRQRLRSRTTSAISATTAATSGT